MPKVQYRLHEGDKVALFKRREPVTVTMASTNYFTTGTASLLPLSIFVQWVFGS